MEKLSRIKALFCIFFGISSISLGGGLTMLPVMQREFVEKRSWMTPEEMVDTVAVMQSLPGIIAVNMSSLIGYRIAGVAGALAGTAGVILPPFLCILVIAMGMSQLAANETLNHIFLGVRSAVTALILLSAYKLSRQIVKDVFSAVLCLAGFLLLVFVELEAIWLIVAAAVVGLLQLALACHRGRKARGGTP